MKNHSASRIGLAGFGLLLVAGATQAAPVASAGPLAGDGDGINTRWVRVSQSPHTITTAREALDGANVVETASFVAPQIDFRDFVGGTEGISAASDLADPFTHQGDSGPTDDPAFAVRYSGFLNIQTAGDYSFQALSDDGFSLALGGEVVVSFDGDRSPASSFVTLTLAPGLYSLEMIGWEQGGQFVDELSWTRPGESTFHVIGTADGGRALFTSLPAPVPLPAALPLLLGGLAGLGACARRSRA